MSNLQDFKGENFDIILQGGQSNAEGCGLGPAAGEYQPDDNILYMNNTDREKFTHDYFIARAEERVWDGAKVNEFALSFAKEYQKKYLKDGRKILILRTAVGGTGWRDGRWGMTNDLYLNMMGMIKAALELNLGNRLKAFLWHQGETDAGSGRDTHYNNLSALVKSVYDTYNYDKKSLPFIAGDFVNEWKLKNLQACEPTVAAILDVCKDFFGAFVATSDLKSNNQEHGNGDDIHFSRNALDILGRRYFEAFKYLLNMNGG
jgi:hypothetical protein